MTDNNQISKKEFSADWFLSGALARIGDAFDRLAGRNWQPSSSLATSELIERMKWLIDSEAKDVPGKGVVIPHSIRLKMQWDKFSADSESTLVRLENELLAAAVDHINDSLYYTYAPLSVKVTPDYFTEGVKLFVSFDNFSGDEHEGELDVAIPPTSPKDRPAKTPLSEAKDDPEIIVAHYELNGVIKEKRLKLPTSGRLSIGRAANNELALDDVSVSKIHASLVVDKTGLLSVADTGSTNGTFINGERISYGKAMQLFPSDAVKFGTVEVVFEYVSKPAVELEDPADDDSVEIDGLEFKSLVSTDAPVGDAVIISGPDDTLKIKAENADETVKETQNQHESRPRVNE